ncbi:Pentatricopeptide repeat-containing protein [Actinidia chinensis var. chinensis]|uniref:Pentatricopeptide repeat-containing protein n=1 Tax=Actinidia chinensis var. chinensis TaxID=1590841 RepID=A0A2R6QLF7_ACTCC|nr:Pentatricopeptide repeat-containing protein [Actinidia chinensis var. chinensis]
MIKWPKQITATLVEQLIRAEKDIHKAILIFDAATGEYTNGFRHDHSTFGLMISRFVSANQFRAAEDLLNRMKDENCDIVEDIFLSICRGYGRVHKPLEAIRIFQKMKEYECKRTQKSYITVFAILVGENQLKLALRFYRYMREKGIPPSVTSLNVLIKALCKNSGTMDAALKIFHEMPNRGCIPDSYTYGTLISGLCRFGKTNEANELFLEMSDKGCSPTVVTYSSLIHGLCQSNNLDEAMGLLDDMKSKGIEPNVFTFSSLMDGLCKGGHSSQAMELLEIMVSKRHKPNTITYSTLIHGLCKEGKLQESLEILDRMKLQGLKPDAGLYWKIINGFCEVRKFQKAANFIDEMVLDGITPNRVTWSLHVRIHNTVVQGLLSESEPNRSFQLYLSMRSRGLSVEAKTFDLLINCFCKKGDLHKAARIVEEMVLDGCIPDEGTWTAIVSGFWDRRKVRETADSIQIELMDKVVESGI